MKISSMLMLILILLCLVIVISFSIIIINIDKANFKNDYKVKMNFALSAVLDFMNDDLDDGSLNNIADGKFIKVKANKDKLLKIFLGVLDLNFTNMYMNDENRYFMSRYIKVFMLIENDGIYVNILDDENNRLWLEKIPYILVLDSDKYVMFGMDGEFDIYRNSIKIENLQYKNEILQKYDIKQEFGRIIQLTINRQLDSCLELCGYTSNLPVDEVEVYNCSQGRGVIAFMKNIPGKYNTEIDVVSLVGGNEKQKNKYTINEDGKFYKVNVDKLTGVDDMIFDTKKECALEEYRPLI